MDGESDYTTYAWANALDRMSTLNSPEPEYMPTSSLLAPPGNGGSTSSGSGVTGAAAVDLKVQQLLQKSKMAPTANGAATYQQPTQRIASTAAGRQTTATASSSIPYSRGGGALSIGNGGLAAGGGVGFTNAGYSAARPGRQPYQHAGDYIQADLELEEKYKNQTSFMKRLARNRIVIAIACGVIVAVILTMLNPPFVQKRAKSKLYRAGPDATKLLLLGGLSAAAVLFVPMMLQQRKSHRTSTK